MIMEAARLSTEIVDRIRIALTGRRGLRQQWEQIDKETQAEILKEWALIVKECLLRPVRMRREWDRDEFQLSQWVDTEGELEFMRQQLAIHGVPSRIQCNANGKFAVFRPEEERVSSE